MSTSFDHTRFAFDAIDALSKATSTAELMRIMGREFSVFGYQAFVITGLPEPPEIPHQYYLLDGWPQGWSEAYMEHAFYPNDPVGLYGRQTIHPFDWDDAPVNLETQPRAREVMGAAGEFGMKKGMLVPIVGAGGFQAAVSMGGEKPDLSPDSRRAIHLVSIFAHVTATRMIRQQQQLAPKLLSEREKEIMRWTAAGKTSWEISRILSVSENTVNSHMKSVMRKLDASTRAHAVARALATGEIPFG